MKTTYAKAHDALYAYAVAAGWTVSAPTLATRHLTSPGGEVRLWLRPQAIYYTRGSRLSYRPHDAGSARSLWVDIRALTPEDGLAECLRAVRHRHPDGE